MSDVEIRQSVLSLEDKEVIRRFMLSCVVLPGAILTIATFALGFFVNEVARGDAYQSAYASAMTSSMQVSSGLISDISKSATEVRQSAEEAEDALSKANGFKERLTEFETILNSDDFARKVAAAPGFADLVTGGGLSDFLIMDCGSKSQCPCPNEWERSKVIGGTGDVNNNASGNYIYLCVKYS